MMIRRLVVLSMLASVLFVPAGARASHACDGTILQPVGNDPILVGAPYPLGVSTLTCTGTARQSEGYVAVGTWTLKVKRGYATTTYSNTKSPPCWTSIIQAGDEITPTVTTGFMFIAQDQDIAAKCP